MFSKTIQLTCCLLFLSAVCYSQKAKIYGNIAGFKESTLVLNHAVADSSRNDTVAVKNGKFIWEADMPYPERVYLFFPTQYVAVFAEKGRIDIKGTVDSLDKLKITGSKTQDEANAFDRSVKDIADQETPLYEKYGKGSKEEQAALEAKLNDLRMQRRARTDQYIASHPKSAFSTSLVTERAAMGEYADVKKLYDLLDPSAQASVAGKQLGARLVILKRSAMGETMLNFTQNNSAGQPVSFSDFQGKYVLVDFWASWCGPCRAENPNVLSAYNNYKDKNFTVIGVSLDDDGDKWKKAIKDDNMPWTQVSDLKGWNNQVSSYYGIQGIPSNFLIDPQGKIIAKGLRGAALDQKLATLFN